MICYASVISESTYLAAVVAGLKYVNFLQITFGYLLFYFYLLQI
jgi:hypothetical protein